MKDDNNLNVMLFCYLCRNHITLIMKHFVVSLLYLIVYTLSWGQTVTEYRGKMQMKETLPGADLYMASGEGYYRYYLSDDGKRVKHGEYVFATDGLQSFSVKGLFSDGKKSGEWTIQKGFALGGNGDAFGKKYSYSLTFGDDMLNGPFTYDMNWGMSVIDDDYLNRIVMKEHIIVTGNYKENHFTESINVKWIDTDNPAVLKGQFDDDGYADGVWEYSKAPIITYVVFEHGIKTRIYAYDDSTGETEDQDIAHSYCIDRFFHNNVDGFDELLALVLPCFGYSENRVWTTMTKEEMAADQQAREAEARIIEEEIRQEETTVLPLQLVEDRPTFNADGTTDFSYWVKQHVVIPEVVKENNITGKVIVGLIVERDGSVSNVQILRGLDDSLDNEVIRVMKNSPKWEPGKHRDKPVRVSLTITVMFR